MNGKTILAVLALIALTALFLGTRSDEQPSRGIQRVSLGDVDSDAVTKIAIEGANTAEHEAVKQDKRGQEQNVRQQHNGRQNERIQGGPMMYWGTSGFEDEAVALHQTAS